MAYSSGGTIEATDYNNFASNINTIWGTGAGSNGYGQSTTLSTVAATNTVSATNWATMIARIDSIRNHQSGTTSGLSQPSAGNTVTYLSTMATLTNNSTGTIFANKLLYNSTRGTAIPTGLGNPVSSNATAWSSTSVKEFSVTFTSVDTVRYFFNAGGVLTSYISIPTVGFTSKSNDWGTFMSTQVGTISLGSNYCSRSGTGGDNLTQNTGTGFHSLTTTYQTLFNIGSTSATADYGLNSCLVEAKLGGALYGASSNIVYIKYTMTDSAADTFNDTVTGTVGCYVGYTPPELTYLANVWGTPGTAVSVTNTQS